jgi:hypothetical protein
LCNALKRKTSEAKKEQKQTKPFLLNFLTPTTQAIIIVVVHSLKECFFL